jgi:hypothetical protein
MRWKKRAWSPAVISLRPQGERSRKCLMSARSASRSSLRSPTIPSTRVAVTLSDQRIIGASKARSSWVSARFRTDARFRYATRSIALRTLADGAGRHFR